jgi:hypothetical protein
MTNDPTNPRDFSPKLQAAMDLISALCDDRITPEQFSQLDTLVYSDLEVRALYVETMHVHAGLYYFASALSEMQGFRLGEETPALGPELRMDETMVMPAMAEPEAFETIEELTLPGPSNDARGSAAASLPLWQLKAGIAAIMTLVLGLLAYFLPSFGSIPEGKFSSPIVREPWYVASLDLASAAVWNPSGMPTHDGRFVAGESLILDSGAVQLQLRHNGKLVVEGPAEVRFISDSEFSIHRGRVVATFPGGGLVVQCPTGTVRDLGTEFGVSVASDGNTEVAVFKGRVLASRATPHPEKSQQLGNTPAGNTPAGNTPAGNTPAGNTQASSTGGSADMVLTVGQAAMMSEKALTKSPEGAVPQRFICNLQNLKVSSLDVADLIGGGDGTTRRRGVAVDALTGKIGLLPPVPRRSGDHLYHRVSAFPAVDGAFIPDGSIGASIVDSAGDQFKFPATTNSSVNNIWTGGHIPWADDTGKSTALGISTVIAGTDYSAPEHSIICTHSNNALTLDLNAIRRLYPDRTLAQFTCKYGNSFINGWPGSQRINPPARAFVLIDGTQRYANPLFTNQDGAMPVNIPIRNTDRFLTLAATDDGKDIDRDWILWVDAKLGLLSDSSSINSRGK